ncbi:MAG: ABC transporter ATP-binding protein [Spirochaetes bacterium]|jgi:ATP-binding cassette subfamily B multidrug efflux pump|nr:ABC transporter ATP-binding protein [Spirochaetota bacterium]
MTNKELYKKILFFVKPYRLFFVAALLFSVITVVCELAVPVLTRTAIDTYIGKRYYLVPSDEATGTPVTDYGDTVITLSSGELLINYGSISELSVNHRMQLLANEENMKLYYLVHKSMYEGKVTDDLIEKDDYFLIEFDRLRSLPREFVANLRANDIRMIVIIFLVVMGLTIVNFIFAYSEMIAITWASNHVIHDIRMKLFKSVIDLPITYFENHKTGKTVTRLTNDVENIQEFFAAVFINIIKDVAIIAGIIGVLIYIDRRLGLVTLAMLPLVAIISAVFRKKMRDSFARVREALAVVNGRLSETLSGIAIIQIFIRQKEFQKKFVADSKVYRKSSARQVFINSVFTPLISMIRYCGMGLIIYLGANDVARGIISLGTLVIFIAYLEKFFRPIQDIAEKIHIVQSALASADRIFPLMEEEPEYDNTTITSCEELLQKKAEHFVEFDNVWFAYRGEEWVLKDFSFTIAHGEVVALVGETGCGKSTVINLLSRLYGIQHGDIYINGINIRLISKKVLRKFIGVVQQNVTLFSDTVKYNILLGADASERRSFEDVCNYTNCSSFIDRLPQKAQTVLSEDGRSLSFGERQLISFARIVAYNPQIFVLDEATSNIDSETEIAIQDALVKILKEKSSIVIAHRLSTIRHSDKIIVIDKGRIIESGSHTELIALKKNYYRLYVLQYKEHLAAEDISGLSDSTI